MKKLDMKSIAIGFILGTVGIVTVSAGQITSAVFSDAAVTFDGNAVELSNPMVSITTDGSEAANLYMPVRELLEHLGYTVEWDDVKKTIAITPGYSVPPEFSAFSYADLFDINFETPVQTALKKSGDTEHMVRISFSVSVMNSDNSHVKMITDKEAEISELVTALLGDTTYEEINNPDFSTEFSELAAREINSLLNGEIVLKFSIIDFLVH